MIGANFYVYVHSRHSNGDPFYVGKGRYARHRETCRRSRHWKNIVAKDGGFYSSFIATDLDEELAFLLEKEMIDKYRRLGVMLANVTNGGDGVSGFKHSEEYKKQLSVRMTGYKPTPETRLKLRIASTGNKHCLGLVRSAEAVEKIASSNRGKKRTPEQLQRISGALKARSPFFTKEAREKMASRMTGNKHRLGHKHSDETRAKMRAAHQERKVVMIGRPGRKASEETREKISKARCMAVRCVDTGEVFDCALSAARHFGCQYRTLVGQCCRGVIKSAHGHTFEYVNRPS